MAEQSREPEILKSIIDDAEYNKTPQSRNEEILLSILNDTEYTKTPQSREEELLLELKDKIGHGITVEPLSVTENGIYTAPTGKAYSPVEVTITPPQIIKRVTGNPVEFSDGADAPVVKCVTQITGSQDLHGYDKPWVGGAGKNKLPLVLADIKARNTSGTWSGNDYTRNGVTFSVITDESENITGINATGTATANTAIDLSVADVADNTPVILNGCPSGGGETSYYIGISSLGYHCIGADVSYNNYSNFVIYCFVPSGYAIPSGGVIFTPMVRLSTEADSTFEPYSNICPITAYTEGEIEVRGRNIANPSVYKQDYVLSSNGSENSATDYCITNRVHVDASTVYTCSLTLKPGGNDALRLGFYDEDMNFISRPTVRNESFTTPVNAYWMRLSYNNVNPDLTNIMIVKGSVPYAYEPYVKNDHTTTYPSAIYRGSEDVVNGEVTSEYGMLGATDFDTFSGTSSGGLHYVQIDNLNSKIDGLCICNMAEKNNSGAWSSTVPCVQNATTGRIRLYCDCSTLQEFQTKYADLQIAYEFATPETSSVTPTNLPIKSLSGYNHIESSTGEMVLDYITNEYQNFVDTVNRAVPNTRKGGTTAMDVFMSLEQYEEPEPDPEDDPTEDMKGESR